MGTLLPTVTNAKVNSEMERTTFQKVGSALFYAVCSNTLVFVNKSLLTNDAFPSRTLLGCGQMVSAITILYVLRACKVVSFPRLSRDIIRQIFPLPLFYLANMLTGLGSTALLSLPMFTVLRRFSILFTMILEFIVLQVRPNRLVIWSVVIMIAGALVAAGNDLAFELKAYTFILLNDLFTALYGVYTKKRLNSDLGKYGLLFYNSVFSLPIALTLAHYNDEIDVTFAYPGWSSSFFCFKFTLSCVFGFVLMYSLLLCTHYNSSLTTTVTGCMKNICITYVGMVLPGSDYVFSFINFTGINISVAGSLIYSYVVFKTIKQTPKS